MSGTIRVRAVAGRMLPCRQRLNAFVGYAEVTQADLPACHSMPGGRRYKRVGEVEVSRALL